jgi:hypothetical protein
MLLDASTTSSYNQSIEHGLRWTFHIVTGENMHALGKAFARAILPPAEDVLRIGLVGTERAGKSTFVEGMLETVGDRTAKEEAHIGTTSQAVWHAASGIWIRHYDCRIEYSPWKLKSYEKNDVSACGLPRVDLVEHPKQDRHDTKFNCFVDILSYGTGVREVKIVAPLDFPGLEKLQALADSFSSWAVKPANDSEMPNVPTAPRAATPI